MESGEMDLLSKQAILNLPRDKEFNLEGKLLAEYINVKDIEALPTIHPIATDTNVGDTISRQWLLECINDGWIKFDTDKDENRFIHLVRDIAPTIQPEPQWIPVSERMPEEHEWLGTKKFGTTMSDEVYVTFENSKGERFTKHLHFFNGELSSYDKTHMDVWYKDYKPIAWMPLPKPFEGGIK